MVISAAGAVRHANVVRHAEALFGGLTDERRTTGERPAKYVGGVRVSEKPFEQSHLLIGFPSPSYRDDAFFTAQVFSGLFGGGMSSRLFQEVREKRGLCYAIYSTAWGLRDAGLFGIHAATGTGLMGELIDVIGAELKRAAEKARDAAELARSKAQLKAGLLMSLESSSARAEQMARHVLTHNRVLTNGELMDKVDAVTAEDARDFAARLAASDASVSVVGSGRRSRKFAERVAEHGAAPSALGGAADGIPAIHHRSRQRRHLARARRVAARAADGRLRALGRAARAEPRSPDPVGADLAAR